MADVERCWFRERMAGQDAPPHYWTDDGDFNGAWSTWRAEVAFAEQFVAEAPDLGIKGRYGDGKEISLRELLLHMVEEYARHNGHADLLRERIDGRVGQ
jgi:uncharacterized damage-inducible protein DinB